MLVTAYFYSVAVKEVEVGRGGGHATRKRLLTNACKVPVRKSERDCLEKRSTSGRTDVVMYTSGYRRGLE
jgi:hypothetical protein